MRLTRALSRPVERHVMHLDIRSMRLDVSWREALMEACLMGATTLLVVASLALGIVVNEVTGGSSATWARLLEGAEGGVILASILLLCLHLVRYAFWYARSRSRRSQPDLGEIPRRVPPLMSTDWDFALALGIIVASALAR